MKLEALKELDAKVEAGDEFMIDRPIQDVFGGYRDNLQSKLARASFHGSLNAAKALHDAVLSNWCWRIDSNIEGNLATVWEPIIPLQDIYHGATFDENSARAWLLAILRALIAQEEGK